MELAASSRTPNFPLALLAAALNNPDYSFEYLGLETLDGTSVHHIRLWNTYSSEPRLSHLAEFSIRDLWIAVATGLPHRIAYDEREARGAVPRIAVAASFSDYRNVSGILYPFRIERAYNGTPWATITIEKVTFNSDVSGTDFAVR